MSNIRLLEPMNDFIRDFEKFPKWLDFPNIPVLFKGGEPRVDIFQTDTEVVMKADVPGLTKQDLQVTVAEDTITVRGEAKSSTDTNKENYYYSERFYGSFCRTLPLPVMVEAGKAKAKFEDGVLTVSMPKAAKAEKGNAIKIE